MGRHCPDIVTTTTTTTVELGHCRFIMNTIVLSILVVVGITQMIAGAPAVQFRTSRYSADTCISCEAMSLEECRTKTKTKKERIGNPCVFPFTYKGHTYDGCTKDRNKDVRGGGRWCATTDNYAVGSGKWATCGDHHHKCPWFYWQI